MRTESAKEVVLLSGGSASGKTEFYSEYLSDQKCIVFDSTLSTCEGAKIKLRKIEKAGKKSIIVAVIPDDLQRSFKAFLGRKRAFGEQHFYRTHAGSRKSLLWIAREFPFVELRLYESSYNVEDMLRFRPLNFEDRNDLIAFLESIQYSEDDIESEIIDLISPL